MNIRPTGFLLSKSNIGIFEKNTIDYGVSTVDNYSLHTFND